MTSDTAAFSLNDDGTAKDPAAFRAALKADPERVKALMVSYEHAYSAGISLMPLYTI